MPVAREYPKLFNTITDRNPDYGGVEVLNIGEVNAGKTSLMVHYVVRIDKHRREVAAKLEKGKIKEEAKWVYTQISKEKLYWVGDEDCQFNRIPDHISRHIFIERGLKLEFYLNGKPIRVKHKVFRDYKQLTELAKDRGVNVVYFKSPDKVMEFIEYLVQRPAQEWSSVFIDEMEYIAPAYAPQPYYGRIQLFAQRLAKARKNWVSLYATLQQQHQLDWRVPRVMRFRGLCPAADVPSGFKIFSTKVRALKLGEAYISNKPFWHAIKYPAYKKWEKMKVIGLTDWYATKEMVKAAAEIDARGKEEARVAVKNWKARGDSELPKVESEEPPEGMPQVHD